MRRNNGGAVPVPVQDKCAQATSVLSPEVPTLPADSVHSAFGPGEEIICSSIGAHQSRLESCKDPLVLPSFSLMQLHWEGFALELCCPAFAVFHWVMRLKFRWVGEGKQYETVVGW